MCMAAGIDPPAEIFVHGYLLMGGQKLGKTMIASGLAGSGDDAAPLKHHRRLAARAGRRLRRRPAALPPPARRRRSARDGDFSYEGIVARYNADLANNLGNLVSRVATVVHSKCDGIGPAPDRGERAGRRSRRRCSRRRRAPGPRWAPHEALEETWRLIGAANAELEAAEPWKMEPGPAVDAVLGDALEVLRIVAMLVAPGHAVDGGRDLAPHRPGRATPTRPGCPGTPAWGGYPGGDAGGQGRAAVPAAQGLTRGPGWFDSHCHVQEEYLGGGDEGGPDPVDAEPVLARAAEAGVDRLVCIGTGAGDLAAGARPGPGVTARARARRRGSGRRSASTRTRRARASTRWPRCWRAVGGGATARSSRWASAGSTTTTSTRHATRSATRSPPRSRWRTRTTSRWSSTPATRGTTSSTCSTAEGVPERTVLHCFTGGPDEATVVSRRHVRVVQRHRHVQERGRRARGGRALPARPLAGRDGQPVPRAGAASRPAPTSRRYVPLVGEADRGGEGLHASTRSESARPLSTAMVFSTGS